MIFCKLVQASDMQEISEMLRKDRIWVLNVGMDR